MTQPNFPVSTTTALSIVIKVGYSYLLLDPTPDNLEFAVKLARTGAWDYVPDAEYNGQCYAVDPTSKVLIELRYVDRTHEVTVQELQALIKEQREAIKAAEAAATSEREGSQAQAA